MSPYELTNFHFPVCAKKSSHTAKSGDSFQSKTGFVFLLGGKFWKRWEYQTTWPSSWEICMQVRKQQLELDMEQQTGSK